MLLEMAVVEAAGSIKILQNVLKGIKKCVPDVELKDGLTGVEQPPPSTHTHTHVIVTHRYTQHTLGLADPNTAAHTNTHSHTHKFTYLQHTQQYGTPYSSEGADIKARQPHLCSLKLTALWLHTLLFRRDAVALNGGYGSTLVPHFAAACLLSCGLGSLFLWGGCLCGV